MITHLEDVGSDHHPILIHSCPSLKRMQCQSFFYSRWVEDEDTEGVVGAAWSSTTIGTPMFSVHQKIKESHNI
ncbi:conserved hypothetical protein [Ricinus communis]|uniref:Uncharacterized protein n=1 Tax=Ricinus communis TaxID=3988 RepID=B9RPR8_RICCO|nr:conserved hypothetical protein [Ricinus communis]